MKKYIPYFIIISLITLLIIGHLINRKNSFSKKNEISNFAKQLQIRNEQIAKIQNNLLKNKSNINDLISEKSIVFQKIFENSKLTKYKKNLKILNEFSISKYTSKDILFSGNINALGTGYIDFFNNDQNLLLTTYDGIFAFSNLNNIEKFTKIKSNISKFVSYENFYSKIQYGIKDIYIDKNKVYVSYIDKEKKNCYDLKIISADLNLEYLKFEKFFKPSTCVDTKNKHGYWPHQGAGGRIFKIDDNNILFSTGEFRNRPLAQKLTSDYGKIIKINTQTKKSIIVSQGHRNPQGLFYSEKFDFILSTEHGPKGGDEINLNPNPFNKVKNFGWPISSYGEHYHNNYPERILKEAPLNKNHKKYGFIEPIKYFDPSIGISEVKSISENDDFFLIGSMGNEIKDQDLGLHIIRLDKNYKKIIEHNYIPINERVRDIIVSRNKDVIVLFLETSSSLLILKK